MTLPRVVDVAVEHWQEHPRFAGISFKGLLTASDNPFANVNIIQVPPDRQVGRHHHSQQFETIWVISGKAILTLDQTEVSIRDGQIIAIPIGLEHSLRNEGPDLVELLTFFTPPLP
jgi:mannose-6-phosphate isomerase-like protein (cupin superfamily)